METQHRTSLVPPKSWHAAFWDGFRAACSKEPFNSNATQPWRDGYRYAAPASVNPA